MHLVVIADNAQHDGAAANAAGVAGGVAVDGREAERAAAAAVVERHRELARDLLGPLGRYLAASGDGADASDRLERLQRLARLERFREGLIDLLGAEDDATPHVKPADVSRRRAPGREPRK